MVSYHALELHAPLQVEELNLPPSATEEEEQVQGFWGEDWYP
jgi:hypothetical protein